MDIGKIISKIRKDKGMQQGELALKAGITQASLSNIEKGNTKRPSNNSLEPICYALDISIAELYIYSIEVEDFPSELKERYETFLPLVKSLMEDIRTNS